MVSVQYLLSATLCLSITYLAFRMLYDHSANFRQQRIFLLFSLVVSLVMPLSGFRLDLAGLFGKQPTSLEVLGGPGPGKTGGVLLASGNKGYSVYVDTAIWIYFIVALVFILAIVIHLIKIIRIYRESQKSPHGRQIILTSTKLENPFSFFNWIFIPPDICDPEERKSIIAHENIHVSQYHSVDNLLVELIAAAMWFNPLVWMMKKSLHLVHEYLADEGTLCSGVDRLRYQAFLLNRVTEESLICLPSGFNQSLIKKRMIMMTKSKIGRRNKFRILALIPLSAVLLLIASLLNGLFPQKVQAEISQPEKSVVLNRLSVSGAFSQQDTLRNHTVRLSQSSGKIRSTRNVEKIEGSNNTVRIISDTNGKDSTIYIVDGKWQSDLRSIKPDSIVSINVIADSMVYSNVKNTVVVTLKHPVKIKREVVVEPVEGEPKIVVEPVEGEPKVVVEPVEGEHEVVVECKEAKHEQIEVEPGKVSFPDEVIYYIDGKKATKSEVDKIDPEIIESVSVFKGDGAKEAGVNKMGVGVVKIITKKP